jgi:hypothetical protein
MGSIFRSQPSPESDREGQCWAVVRLYKVDTAAAVAVASHKSRSDRLAPEIDQGMAGTVAPFEETVTGRKREEQAAGCSAH